MKSFRDFIKFAMVPLTLVVLVVISIFLQRFLSLPNFEEVLKNIKIYYTLYGYWLVFFGAIFEGLLFLNWYLPGSMIIVFGVIFTQGHPERAVVTVILVIIAFFITTIFNYVLGKYGWYRVFIKLGLRAPLDRIRARVEQVGLGIIFVTYFHPNVGALTATSIGILRLPFKRFTYLSLIALVLWNSLWGLITYFSGPVVLGVMTPKTIFIMLGVWIVFLLVRFWQNKNKTK